MKDEGIDSDVQDDVPEDGDESDNPDGLFAISINFNSFQNIFWNDMINNNKLFCVQF